MSIIFETERLIVRQLGDSDVQGMFELDSDPEVHRYLGNQPIKSLAEAKAVIGLIRKQYAEVGIGRLAMIEKKTNEFVGWTGIKFEKNSERNFITTIWGIA